MDRDGGESDVRRWGAWSTQFEQIVARKMRWLLVTAFVVACKMSVDLNPPRVQPPTSPNLTGIFLANCSKTSIPGLTSIPQLGTGTYQGQQGGLYPGGSNTIPAPHLALGLSLASEVVPRDAAGNVDFANGKIVQISFGASTAVRVFAGDSAMMNGIIQTAYKPYADADPAKNPNLVIVNTAQANKPLKYWLDPADSAWIILDQRLTAAGVTPAQVQVGWFMIAEGRAPVFTFPTEAQNYRDSMEVVIRFAKSRYPNMKLGYLSTHYYQGYRPGSTEPNNYEQGFGLKWVIEDQITGVRNMNANPALGPVVAPWIGWARQLWTNGIIPNADGLFFLCSEFDSNGVHLIRAGVNKAGPSLESWFKTDPTAVTWWLNNTGHVGDLVWDDENGNGIQDSGEAGIPNVTVTLTGPAFTRTTTTDASGNYLFNDVPAGDYSVSVNTPAGYVASPSHAAGSNSGNDSDGSPAAVNLPTNSTANVTVDFGFTRGTGSIGDFVWDDQNGDGIQDAGEPGIAGVTVTLSGAASATTTTDGNGTFVFTNLFAGSYTVSAAAPAGYSPSPANQGGDPLKDSNTNPAAVTLASNNSTDPSIDIGFTQHVTGQIGDLVWSDTNGNGVQDAGEPGLAGITVSLSGSASASTTTDATGHYLFGSLLAGTYTVTVATPAGYSPSPSQQGGDPLLDSDGSPATVTLPSDGSIDLGIDFGFVTNASGQIGDLVWYDVDGNGVQDAGEAGMPGVSVTLSGPGGTQVTTTNGSGQYLFTGLAAGSYTVTFATPAGYVASPAGQGADPTKDSNGSPAAVTLATGSSSDPTIDAGFTKGSGSIGDFVWNDLNFNGIQDAGEPGIAGVTVTLSGPASATTTTAANGSYAFTNLFAGTYTVTVTKPSGYSSTLSNQGSDPLKDSNSSPASVTLAANNSTGPGTDFGFVLGQIITLDQTSSATSAAGLVTSLAWSHKVTAGGTNRILLVSVGVRNKTSQTVSTVKWGSANLTRIQGISQGTAVRSELWYLINPATGVRTITVTLSGAATSVVAGAISYTGVHQTTPLGTAVTKAIASNKNASLTVTSAVREVVVDGVVKQNALELAVPAAGQVQRWTNKSSRATGSDNVVGAGSEKAGAASVSMSWTSAVARAWAMVAVPLKPAP